MKHLTERQEDVLESLVIYCSQPDYWARVMDVGGENGSHHHRTLRQLVKKGLAVERKRCVSIVAALGSSRCGREYRPAKEAGE